MRTQRPESSLTHLTHLTHTHTHLTHTLPLSLIHTNTLAHAHSHSLSFSRSQVELIVGASETIEDPAAGELCSDLAILWAAFQRGEGAWVALSSPHPTPETLDLKHETRNPRTRNPNSEPDTRHPKPETRNPTPDTRNPEFNTQNPKPETRNPKPEIRHIQIAQPDTWALRNGPGT